MADETIRILEREEHRDPYLAEKALRARLRAGLPEIRTSCNACSGTGVDHIYERRPGPSGTNTSVMSFTCGMCRDGEVSWPIGPADPPPKHGPAYKGTRGTRIELAAHAGHLGARAYLKWPIARCPAALDPYHPLTVYVPERAAWRKDHVNAWLIALRRQPLEAINGNLVSVYPRFDAEGYLIAAAETLGIPTFLKAVCPALIALALDGQLPDADDQP